MKIIALFRPNSEHSGLVEDFTRDFKRFKNKKLELLSLNTIEGDDMARLYDITQYPAFLAISESGGLQRLWQGNPLPLMDELAYYSEEQINDRYKKISSQQIRVIQPLSA